MRPINIFDLSEKVAIVTGGCRGIGKSIGTGLAHAGADVIIVDVLLPEAEKVAKEIVELGRRSFAIRTDVSEETDVQKMAEKVMAYFGKVDILVNNAGINIYSPAEDFNVNDWDKVVNVDLKGVFLCSKTIGKIMIKQKKGKIINIASVHGLKGSLIHDAAAYNSSKAGVINLTRSLAIEWGEFGINVNAIAPGVIMTDLTRKRLGNKEYYNYWVERMPLRRIGKPEDLIGAVVYLATEASDWVTGQTIAVDGGYTAS
jgi:NAD(P)-dependent dehydrogenase (short-subunit alcohol dehydrogenase family)